MAAFLHWMQLHFCPDGGRNSAQKAAEILHRRRPKFCSKHGRNYFFQWLVAECACSQLLTMGTQGDMFNLLCGIRIISWYSKKTMRLYYHHLTWGIVHWEGGGCIRLELYYHSLTNHWLSITPDSYIVGTIWSIYRKWIFWGCPEEVI